MTAARLGQVDVMKMLLDRGAERERARQEIRPDRADVGGRPSGRRASAGGTRGGCARRLRSLGREVHDLRADHRHAREDRHSVEHRRRSTRARRAARTRCSSRCRSTIWSPRGSCWTPVSTSTPRPRTEPRLCWPHSISGIRREGVRPRQGSAGAGRQLRAIRRGPGDGPLSSRSRREGERRRRRRLHAAARGRAGGCRHHDTWTRPRRVRQWPRHRGRQQSVPTRALLKRRASSTKRWRWWSDCSTPVPTRTGRRFIRPPGPWAMCASTPRRRDLPHSTSRRIPIPGAGQDAGG